MKDKNVSSVKYFFVSDFFYRFSIVLQCTTLIII